MTQNKNDIIDLKLRGIKHNIPIHNLVDDDGENLFIKIPALFKEHLGVDNKFVIYIETGGASWINLAQLQEDLSTSLTKQNS